MLWVRFYDPETLEVVGEVGFDDGREETQKQKYHDCIADKYALEQLVTRLEKEMFSARRHTDLFVVRARAYCDARLEYLDLKRQVAKMATECEALTYDEQFGAYSGTPCWKDTRFVPPDDAEELPIEDRCEVCQKSAALLERRRALGRRMSGLAAQMYAAYRLQRRR